jgi:hypothetical protein
MRARVFERAKNSVPLPFSQDASRLGEAARSFRAPEGHYTRAASADSGGAARRDTRALSGGRFCAGFGRFANHLDGGAVAGFIKSISDGIPATKVHNLIDFRTESPQCLFCYCFLSAGRGHGVNGHLPKHLIRSRRKAFASHSDAACRRFRGKHLFCRFGKLPGTSGRSHRNHHDQRCAEEMTNACRCIFHVINPRRFLPLI